MSQDEAEEEQPTTGAQSTATQQPAAAVAAAASLYPGRVISPAHLLLRRGEARLLCQSALTCAAAAGQPFAAKLLLDHSSVDVEHCLISLCAQEQAEGLRLLLRPRPPCLQHVPANPTEIRAWCATACSQHPATGTAAFTNAASDAAAGVGDGNSGSMHEMEGMAAGDAGATDQMATQQGSEGVEDAAWGLGVDVRPYSATVMSVAARSGCVDTVQALLVSNMRWRCVALRAIKGSVRLVHVSA
jgi:hypothetical protein